MPRQAPLTPDSIFARLREREKLLRHARRFKRLLATDPSPEQARKLLQASRRFVQPLGETTLAEGGLESSLLDVDESSCSAGFVISAIRRDRHGDVVEPKGCLETLADYKRNPVNFFSHKSEDLPTGLCRSPYDQFCFEVSDTDIRSRTFFHCKTQESHDVWELVALKQLTAASIGFFPLEAEIIEGKFDPHSEEVDFDTGGFHFTKWSIIEWSIVPIPANPDALRSHLESRRGQKMSKSVKGLVEPFAAPLKKRTQVSLATVRQKGVIPYSRCPLAPEDRPWDASGARARIKKWAASGSEEKDKIDWAKYAKAFAYCKSTGGQDGENT